jgi:hypothetical protein
VCVWGGEVASHEGGGGGEQGRVREGQKRLDRSFVLRPYNMYPTNTARHKV